MLQSVFHHIAQVIGQLETTSTDVAKIEALSGYIKGLQIARRISLSIFSAALALLVLLLGIAMLHVALLMAAPPHSMALFITALLLGITDVSLSCAGIAFLFSEKGWMRFSKSEEWMEEMLKSKSSGHSRRHSGNGRVNGRKQSEHA